MSRSQRGTSKAPRADAPPSPGPGITLEVMDGPMDGANLVCEGSSVTIGRSTTNDLALPLDRSVSSAHAVLSRDPESGLWKLEDRRSTNGTWLASGRLSAPQPLPPEGDFVAGHAVIHYSAAPDGESFLPAPDALRTEARRLLSLLDSSAAKAFGAGVALAAAEGAHFVTDRHVARGIALTNPGLLPPRLAKAQVQRFFTEVLRAGGQWSGGQAWVGQLLQAVAWSGETFLDGDDAVTPRLLVVLREAAAAAADRHRDRIPASLLMAALFRPEAQRLRALATSAGLDPEALRTFAEGEAGEATAITLTPSPSPVELPSPAAPTAAPPPPPPPPAPTRTHSSGDPVVDARARDAARGVAAVSALYGIAPPEERQEALRQFLRREVGELDTSQRTLLLEQLQRLFPIAAGSTAGTAELVRLRSRVAQLEEALAGSGEEGHGAGSFAGAWRGILEGQEAPGHLEGTEAAAAGFLREVWSFATSVEIFIVGSVHNLTTQGATTDVVQLPGYRTSLRRVAGRLAEGDPVGLEDLRGYLDAVERWLLVITAAYHEAPRLWFEDFWAKVNPNAVESKLSDAGWKRKLGVESIEFWNYYKEMVHAVNPDLVMDEILRMVRRRAEEHFARLREGRSAP